jgi:hypothetical protein
MPEMTLPFAATQAAYRFLNNKRISLKALAQPLLEAGREEARQSCDSYLLVVHDWSQLMYAKQHSKCDRVALCSNHVPEGYELQTALLISDRDGLPLAPGVLSLRAADGVHCSRCGWVRSSLSPLDELDPTMTYLEEQHLGFPLLHIVDAEADSVWHYRQWSAHPHRRFLVRADDRIVEYAGQEQRFSSICQQLQQRDAFRWVRGVRYHGQKAWQWVTETAVRLTRPAQRNRPGSGDRQRIAGPPLDLRLVIAEIRNADGHVLATWYLLTNLPAEVDAATVALWYYWRWSIETYFKLLKSAGMNVEEWQQETAAAITRRLLVASMACVIVWRLARSTQPQAESARRMLIGLSGRQMKYGKSFTLPALLAGMWALLAMLEVLETHSIDELRELARFILNRNSPNASGFV